MLEVNISMCSVVLFSCGFQNPHQGDISRRLLERLLRQAEISRDEWESL